METVTRHLTVFFEDSICGIKRIADPKARTYNLSQVTCKDCLEAARLEAIENQKALDTLPNCPHCGERAAQVTVSFNVTKVFRLDVQTERDYETQTIKPMIYGTESDTLDTELDIDKHWQVCCDNGHEWFTDKIEQIENGEQWLIVEGETDEVDQDSPDRICPVCGNDRSEHNWEVHTAELRANG